MKINIITMSSVGFDGSSVSRLEGSTNTCGGLVVKKSSGKSSSKTTGESLLGLQKLAEEKRREKEAELESNETKTSKKARLNDWEEDKDETKRTGRQRHYRSQMVETPSHPGGVSDEYKERNRRRNEREMEQRKGGVYADTRKKKESARDKRKDKYSDRSRESKGEKDNRTYSSRRDSLRETRSTRGRYDWEETPSSQRKIDRGSTPSHGSKGLLSTILRIIQDVWKYEIYFMF